MFDPLTRREAMRVVAAAPVAASLIPAAPSANELVVFALIGAGAWGQCLLSHLNRIRSGRCGIVCDVHESNLQKAIRSSRDSPQASKDYRKVLARKDIDAVLIATPLYTHFPITRDALLAGKHVFCEPPLVFQPEEVDQLKELAETRAGQILQVGLQRRYSRFYQTAKQMAAKGFLGELTNIYAQWHRASGWARDPERPKESNWHLYREFSGGLTAEFGSHQIDVGDWMFNDSPEFITGVGSLDWKRDGRDTYDTAALILRYPEGRQMIWSSICTNRHLPLLGGTRREFGEMLMGTEGTIEITIGTGYEPALGLWFYEPSATKVSNPESSREIARIAGATVSSRGRGYHAMPILLERDQFTGEESFLARELKYMRRWLYAKGVLLPEEDRHPVEAQMESFFECCRSGTRPKAHVEVGLKNATAVILANLAMDEARRVGFDEMQKLCRGSRPQPSRH